MAPPTPDPHSDQTARPAGRRPDTQRAAHGLGPHVVGQRVVVRRILPERGPTGGPAFTDVLGTCLAWEDGVCVVQPERGEPVRVPTELIVSGKPVPPRASVRHRVTPREAESHVAALWELETRPLGQWLLRSDPAPVGRLRRRANSCLAMGEPGVPLDEAEQAIRAFYTARDRPAWVHVEAGSDIEQQLRDRGWEQLSEGDAHFQLGSLARARRAIDVRPLPEGVTPRLSTVDRHATATYATGGDEVARGSASLDGDWLGLHSLHVAPSWQRRGLALHALAQLMEWGAEQGATTVWLHVETDNQPALELYASLGLVTHHTARYLGA